MQFAGIPFESVRPDEAVLQTLDILAKHERGHDIHLLNAYSIALAHSNEAFAACARKSSINFPDGKPVALFSRYISGKLHQVRGPQFFEDVLTAGVDTGVRHYFLGSTPETLALLESRIKAKLPNVRIVGTHSPPFRELSPFELAEQDATIRGCDPDIVWVGLGTPKQDFEARRLAEQGFNAAAVGAAFDFTAGTKPISPSWVQRVGLEWLHRLATEPRRLWKRYLWGNSTFLVVVAREVLRREG